jgi:ATP-dependent protease ClpP protease subunit
MDPFAPLDEMLGMGQKNKTIFSGKSLVQQHDLYLTGEIKSAEHYTDWFELLRSAGKSDIIKIHINCYGGDLFTAIQLMRCMTESNGNLVTSVEGACMSAATMIFLASESFEVSEHSAFMFHNYSGISIGKGGEMFEQISFEKKWFNKLVNNVYKDFLTDAEINDIEHGKDLWLDGDEVVVRLKKMGKLETKSQIEMDLGEEDEES